MASKGANLALKITGDSSDAKRAMDDTEERGHRFGGAMGKIGLAAAAGIGLAAVGFAKLYQAADESRKIAALTEQVIKSTGGAAQISAAQVGDLAAAIANKTGVDDEAIQSGANLLLTFTNVKNGVGAGNDIFNQATKIMTDMSVALGTDASGSAIQLGKALNDPVKGVTALSKVGVSFTADQKKQIEALVKTGDTMGAQKIILNELGKEFGGAAEAAATPLGKLQQRAGDFAEKLGGFLLPVVDKAATFLGDKLMPAVSQLAEKLGPMLGPIIQQAGQFITTQLIPAVMSLAQELGPKLLPIFQTVGGIIKDFVVPAFIAIVGIVKDYVIPIFKTVLAPALDGLKSAWGSIAEALDRNRDKFSGLLEKVKPLLEFLRDKVAPFVGGVLKVGFEVLGTVIGKVIDAIAWILDKAAAVGGFIGKVGGFLFGGAAPADGQPTAGAARTAPLYGAAPQGPRLFGASMSLTGGAVGPGAAGQGLAVGDTYVINVSGALDPAAVAEQISRLLDRYARRTGAAPAFGLAR